MRPTPSLRSPLELSLATSVAQCKATVLAAPIGYGKTTALRRLYSSDYDASCWISLCQRDRDPKTLIRTVQTSLHEYVRGGDRRGSLLEAPGSIEEWMRSLQPIPADTVIIIDDADYVAQSRQASPIVRRLVEETPDFVHFVLAVSSRRASSLILDNERRSDVTEFGASDLAFGPEDIETLLNWHRVPVKQWLSVQRQLAVCDGWPLAVGLGLRHLRPMQSGAMEIDPPLETILRPMLLDLVRRLSSQQRKLVGMLCQLERAPVGIVEHLAARDGLDGELDRMVLSFPLICETPGRREFTVHPLVRKCLACEEWVDGAIRSPRLHSQVAMMFQNQGDHVSAFAHSIAADDLDAAFDELSPALDQLTASERWSRIREVSRVWLAAGGVLPNVAAGKVAAAEMHDGEPRAAVATLDEALSRDGLGGREIGALLVLRSFALRMAGSSREAVHDGRRAVDLSPQMHPRQRINGLRGLAAALVECVRMADAGTCYAAAVELASLEGLCADEALLRADYGSLLLLEGRMAGAMSELVRATEVADRVGLRHASILARNNRGMLEGALGRPESANGILREAISWPGIDGVPRLQAMVWNSMGDVLYSVGNDSEAVKCYRRGGAIALAVSDVDACVYAMSGEARALAMGGAYCEAAQVTRQCAEQVADCSELTRYAVSNAQAVVGLVTGDYEGVIVDLMRDMQFLLRGGLQLELMSASVRYCFAKFMTSGREAVLTDVAAVEELLRDTGAIGWVVRDFQLASRLTACLSVSGDGDRLFVQWGRRCAWTVSRAHTRLGGRRLDDPLPAALSDRERVLVAALCDGLSRDDIAQRLGRSRSTIDKGISSLYAATGFESCYQIVAWANRVGASSFSGVRGAGWSVEWPDRQDMSSA